MTTVNYDLTSAMVLRLLTNTHYKNQHSPVPVQCTVMQTSTLGSDSLKVSIDGISGTVVLIKLNDSPGFKKGTRLTIAIDGTLRISE